MEKIATARGFTATILRTAQATRDAVTDAIKSAAQQLVKGDIFWVSYSGTAGRCRTSTATSRTTYSTRPGASSTASCSTTSSTRCGPGSRRGCAS